MSTVLGTCGCNDPPKTLTPGTAFDASETVAKQADRTLYTFLGTPKTTFASFAEKYAWMKGRGTCTQSSPCFNTTGN